MNQLFWVIKYAVVSGNNLALFMFLRTMSGKKYHYIFAANFAECWPIFKILSPTDLPMNLQ